MKHKKYVMLPCFTVEIRENGQGAELTCNRFLSWIFRIFFAPFWHGKVYIEDGEHQ